MTGSGCSGRVRSSSWRLRRVVTPSTWPDRVSKAANRWVAPARLYACSPWRGRPGWAGRVATRRGRGWSDVISSRLTTTACALRRRVSRSATIRTWSAKAASRGVRGCSQTWDRQGFRRSAASIRCTAWGESDATTSSRTSCRASSAQSPRLSDRPACSGSSQARRARCKATSGGKGPRPTRPWTILQGIKAARSIPIRPGPDHVGPDPNLAGDLVEQQPIRHRQDDPGASRQPGCCRRPTDHALQRGTIFSVQLDRSATARS